MAHPTEHIARRRRVPKAKALYGICRTTERICDGYIDTSTGQQFENGRNSSSLGLTISSLFFQEVEAQGFHSYIMGSIAKHSPGVFQSFEEECDTP